MIAPVVVAVAALVVLVVSVAVAWTLEHRRSEAALQARVRRDVIVTLHDGQSFSGVLFDRDTVCLILRNAIDLQPQASVPVDGELLIRWAEVAYVQLP